MKLTIEVSFLEYHIINDLLEKLSTSLPSNYSNRWSEATQLNTVNKFRHSLMGAALLEGSLSLAQLPDKFELSELKEVYFPKEEHYRSVLDLAQLLVVLGLVNELPREKREVKPGVFGGVNVYEKTRLGKLPSSCS